MKKQYADYMMFFGQRATGKLYQAKKIVIENAYNALDGDICKAQFTCVIRCGDHNKAGTVENYFNDINIEKITEGNYTGIAAVSGDIYLTNRDDKGKAVKGPHIGYYITVK